MFLYIIYSIKNCDRRLWIKKTIYLLICSSSLSAYLQQQFICLSAAAVYLLICSSCFKVILINCKILYYTYHHFN